VIIGIISLLTHNSVIHIINVNICLPKEYIRVKRCQRESFLFRKDLSLANISAIKGTSISTIQKLRSIWDRTFLHYTYYNNTLRPVINLKADVIVTGTGVVGDEYVVQ
jgi:hypothetical protein